MSANEIIAAPAQPEWLTGAELTVRLLERQGVTTLSGIPGGAILPFYDALSASTRIRHVLARHEQGAGFIAQGMARTTGQAAVCLASSGPGATPLRSPRTDPGLTAMRVTTPAIGLRIVATPVALGAPMAPAWDSAARRSACAVSVAARVASHS